MILVTCTITLLTLSLPTKIYAARVTGQLNVISQNQTIQIFDLTDAGDVVQLFSAQLELDLRPPCPSCHPSYNLFIYGDQVILPSPEVLYIFTFLSERPYVYTQSVPIPDCIPLSFTASIQSVNLLFMDCEDLVEEGNFFLAKLQLKPAHHWAYYKLRGFETVGRAGAYAVFTHMDIVMHMMYVHEEHEHIELNDVRSGYVNLVRRPDHCVHAVRISATGKNNLVLIECSSNKASDQVSSIYTLESATFTHLLNTSPYSICPIRFTQDGSVAAIFTEYFIIAIDLDSGAFVNVSVSQAIYDGVITQCEDYLFYLVYSTSTGLHRVSVNLSQEMEISRLGFTDTSAVCAVDGCSLLTLVDSNTVLVDIGLDITLLSISGLTKVAPDVEVKYRPSRNIFQKMNITTAPSVVSDDDDEHSHPTTYTKPPQIDPTPTEKQKPSTSPSKLPIKETTNRKKKAGAIVAVIVLVVIALVAAVVVAAAAVLIIVRRHYSRKKSLIAEIRYDCTRLLLSTPVDDQHPDDDNLGEVEDGKVCVVAVEVLDEKSDDGRMREDMQKVDEKSDDGRMREDMQKVDEKSDDGRMREDMQKVDEKSDDGRMREDMQKDEDEGQNDKDLQKDEDERQNDRGGHRGRKGSREPPQAIPITNISNEVEKVQDSPVTPCTESGPEISSIAVYVKVTQESSIDARFDARQQQVVGSFNKETQEVRESPDGCNQ